MSTHDFIKENEASLAELRNLVVRLDEESLQRPIGTGWTVASTLCHLAFWDQRAFSILRIWESGGPIDAPLSKQTVESLNRGVQAISKTVPGPAAVILVLDSADAVDSYVAGIGGEFIDRVVAAGFERFLCRSLHRREHLQKIREALGGPPAKMG